MPAPTPSDGLWSPQRRSLTLGLVLTITLVAFEALAVSTVMPQVAEELDGIELYGWVGTAFLLGSLIGIVVSGGLIDRRGLAFPFALGVGLFAIGLVAGGLAPSMGVLILARFIQGVGGGAIPPTAYVAIGRTMSEALRPRMFATLSTAWVLPGVFGPAIAGLVGEHVGWRWVFLGLLPLIAVSASIALPALRRVAPDAEQASAEAVAAASLRHRLPRAILIALGVGLFLAGLSSDGAVVIAGFAIPAVAVVVTGTLVGLPAVRALTPPGTLTAARGMPAAVLLRGVLTFMFFAVDFYVPLVLHDVRGESLTEAGITLTAATIAWTAGSWIQARWSFRFAPERFVRAGFIVVVIGLAAFTAVLSENVPVWVAIPTFAIAGIGMGLAYSPLALIVLRDAPPGEQGFASSALSMTDNLGTALGIGVTGALVAASIRGTDGPVHGLVIGFGIAVGVGIVGALLSRRLRGGSRPVVAPGTVATAPSTTTG